MVVLIVMCLGILAGRFIVPKSLKKVNDIISVLCTFLLIFSMGVMLGRKENFIQELATLGFSSLLFLLIPTILSIIIVYLLTKYFLEKKTGSKKQDKENI